MPQDNFLFSDTIANNISFASDTDDAAAIEEAAEREGLAELPITVALMGCAVNGPGEAREADIGIAGGVGEAVLFEHGEITGKIPEGEIIPTLIARIRAMKLP